MARSESRRTAGPLRRGPRVFSPRPPSPPAAKKKMAAGSKPVVLWRGAPVVFDLQAPPPGCGCCAGAAAQPAGEAPCAAAHGPAHAAADATVAQFAEALSRSTGVPAENLRLLVAGKLVNLASSFAASSKLGDAGARGSSFITSCAPHPMCAQGQT